MSLDEYIKKRDFKATPEPPAVLGKKAGSRFVVQRHKATRLHYDLRLEMEGVLKSWAVPKGPSLNPADKRLAVRTEDHPVRYLDFEGTIPKGNYGAGEMRIWDQGRYEVLEEKKTKSGTEQLKKGNLKIRFHGKYLEGDFALVRTRLKGDKENWLLIKKQDKFAVSGTYDAENIEPGGKVPSGTKTSTFIRPMLASLVPDIFNDPDWIYELKWDGYRVQAHVNHGDVRLYSRNGNGYEKKFGELIPELETLEQQAVLDGEVVVVDERGKPDFEALQNYSSKTSGTLRYYVFDLLFLNGHSTLELPLLQRKELLLELLEGMESTRYCDHMVGMGNTFYSMAVDSGMEGIIAKHKDSLYYPGKRTDSWRKIKSERTVIANICGYTEPEGTAHFGSLVLGRRVEDSLQYIGNCGTGFNDKSRLELYEKLKKLERVKSPFEKKPNLKGRKVQWLKPELEAEVKFSDWTKNGLLRHPVFKELQEKAPRTEMKPKNKKQQSHQKQGKGNVLEFEDVQVAVSNLEKIYWPESGFRKYDLLDYYLEISDYILPYLVDRPQNLHRHPDGIKSEGFYQKDVENTPEWVQTYSIYSKSSKRDINYLLCQDDSTLLYMANLGCIEINPWNSKVAALDTPDWAVIDLDPSSKNTLDEVIEVANRAKELLDKVSIPGYCKTSGSRGMHIYVPMGGLYSYDEVMNFTKLLCLYLLEDFPELCSM
ncbi:MAG: DNA ligase D, partial [Flavobacteriaceae bacterium]|nr:DNA ligase D [Flavobacteriaceae bacterium]